ncbi:hypothetical protein SteCoe_21592 [Stentor coeruleus]|uniref:RING-type domain-containing protein n=1 Tax=Stentor coeruleus TaxID=5963 RepID=A0A1R2BP58_9CILI|nr:hypothetical protein SteCoe_21592 [Stentor coeruleus]
MENLSCYCGEDLDFNNGASHLIECEAWKTRSSLFQAAQDLIKETGSISLVKLEAEALMMYDFSEKIIPQKQKKSKSKNRRKRSSDIDEATRKLIEDMQRQSLGIDQSLKCALCEKAHPDMSECAFLNCEHMVCHGHIRDEVYENYAKTGTAKCPICGYTLSSEELGLIVNQEELEKLTPSIADAFDNEDGIIATCPCGLATWLEPGKVDLAYKDESGKIVSKKHAEHMAKYRFRCNCGKVTCAKCKAEPYHVGKTCEEYKDFQSAKHCRFCNNKITSSSISCKKGDCKDRYHNACKKILPCGHQCYGTLNETSCFECLNEDCNQNGSSYCTICYVEGLYNAPCVKLGCGHIYHYQCLETTIVKRWAGPRITFKFARCPACNAWVTTPYNIRLEQDLNIVKALYEDIRDKALKRMKFENEGEDRIKNPKDTYYNDPERYALDRYSYYMCFKCKKPYFGGKKDCEQNNDQAKFNPEELVCPSCSAIGMEGSDCKVHGKDFIEFKCKFCCSVSAWFCWGTTHFCDQCHTRQNNGDYLSKKSKSELPVCPGKTCPLKITHPPNGEEFPLGCTLCRNMIANNKDF